MENNNQNSLLEFIKGFISDHQINESDKKIFNVKFENLIQKIVKEKIEGGGGAYILPFDLLNYKEKITKEDFEKINKAIDENKILINKNQENFIVITRYNYYNNNKFQLYLYYNNIQNSWDQIKLSQGFFLLSINELISNYSRTDFTLKKDGNGILYLNDKGEYKTLNSSIYINVSGEVKGNPIYRQINLDDEVNKTALRIFNERLKNESLEEICKDFILRYTNDKGIIKTINASHVNQLSDNNVEIYFNLFGSYLDSSNKLVWGTNSINIFSLLKPHPSVGWTFATNIFIKANEPFEN